MHVACCAEAPSSMLHLCSRSHSQEVSFLQERWACGEPPQHWQHAVACCVSRPVHIFQVEEKIVARLYNIYIIEEIIALITFNYI